MFFRSEVFTGQSIACNVAKMPRRRNESILDDVFRFLVAAPWWAGPPTAILAFLFFRFVAPWIMTSIMGSGGPDGIGKTIILPSVSACVAIAPVAGGGVILLWLVALPWKLKDAHRLDSITGADSIRRLPWREFERLVAEAFRRQGYYAEVTGSDCGDGGVDVLLERDGQTTLVQCKRWRVRRVGVKPVRELLGTMSDRAARTGVLVTCGTFTPDAEELAERNSITLIAGPELAEMIRAVQTNPAPAPRTARRYPEPSAPPVPVPAGATRPAGSSSGSPACPTCGSPMVQRTARTGPHAGQPFWGCSKYPSCRGIRQMVKT